MSLSFRKAGSVIGFDGDGVMAVVFFLLLRDVQSTAGKAFDILALKGWFL